MTRLDAAAVLLTSPGAVIAALVLIGCCAGVAIGELRDRKAKRAHHRHADGPGPFDMPGGAW
jgi:hypothetical protein